MCQHAFLLTKEQILHEDHYLKNVSMLKPPKFHQDYEKTILKKYPLVTKEDLDYNFIEKALGMKTIRWNFSNEYFNSIVD